MQLKKLTFIILGLLGVQFLAYSQDHPTCDGVRYLEDMTTEVIETTNVQFGQSVTIGGSVRDLFMDVYEPAGDMAEARPAIILAFGGSFIFGNRQDLASMCEDFARKGYVAATIDYRLVDAFLTDTFQLADVVIKASADMKAAVRFLRADAATDNQFRIDPNLIFAGGISAGAITAAHAAYLDEDDEIAPYIQTLLEANGGINGNSNDLEYSSSIQGVLNYSGALKESNWIQADEAPLFSAHDDMDPIVPYGNEFFDTALGLRTYLEGTGSMTYVANNVGLTNDLVTVANSDGHVSYFGANAPTYAAEVAHRSVVLLHNIFCDAVSSVEESEVAQTTLTAAIQVSPNPATTDVTIQLDELPASFDVLVYDAVGRLVTQQNGFHQHQVILSRSSFAKGLHYIQLRFDDEYGTVIRKKLVVQ